MVWIVVAVAIVVLLLTGIKVIPDAERGVVFRLGRLTGRVAGPGLVWLIPGIESMQIISIEPLSVSLPPQSAITRDEIPIQLQASLEAILLDPTKAAITVRDWRIHVMSRLQSLMKEGLEELDFDRLDEVFPSWVGSVQDQLSQSAKEIGVQIQSLQISNLSPRSRPG